MASHNYVHTYLTPLVFSHFKTLFVSLLCVVLKDLSLLTFKILSAMLHACVPTHMAMP